MTSDLRSVLSAPDHPFHWLASELGLERTRGEETRVEYSGPLARFVIALVPASDPTVTLLDAAVGPPPSDSGSSPVLYSIDYLARIVDPTLTDSDIRAQFGLARYPATTDAEIHASLTALSSTWHNHVAQVGGLDEALWPRLERERARRIDALSD